MGLNKFNIILLTLITHISKELQPLTPRTLRLDLAARGTARVVPGVATAVACKLGYTYTYVAVGHLRRAYYGLKAFVSSMGFRSEAFNSA